MSLAVDQLSSTSCHRPVVIDQLSSTSCHRPVVIDQLSPVSLVDQLSQSMSCQVDELSVDEFYPTDVF
jgi:hypothetical protein